MALIWPKEVWILSKTDSLSGGIGTNLDNWPMTASFWVQLELRQVVNVQSIHNISIMHEIWVDRWIKIFACLKKTNIKYTRHDLYNATWASLGYVNEQSERTLSIAALYVPPPLKRKNA